MNGNNRGIVLCFLVYLVLCGTIVSIIEMPWLKIPSGSAFKVNMSEIAVNNPGYNTFNFTKASSVILWNATVPGYCGISGFCYPFEEDSVMATLLTGTWGKRCYQMNPITPGSGFGNSTTEFNMARHTPFYLAIAGSVLLLMTWIIGICSCCNHDCGKCTIYSVIAVFLTLGGVVFAAGVVLLFLFSNDEASCMQRICNAETSFDIGNCELGWTTYVAAISVFFTLLLAICSCVLANKTPLRNKGLSHPVREVRSANKRMMQSAA